ncbi:hypothetical protein ES702_06285 [subsurface metagenome]
MGLEYRGIRRLVPVGYPKHREMEEGDAMGVSPSCVLSCCRFNAAGRTLFLARYWLDMDEISDCLTAVALIFRNSESTNDWHDCLNVEALRNLNLSLCNQIGDSIDQDQVECLLEELIREVSLAQLPADRKISLITWLLDLPRFV